MADPNPNLSGPYQSDPELQRLIAAYNNTPQTSRGARDAVAMELKRYIEANRQRLGVPDNYFPDPRTGGQSIYDPNQNVWRDTLLTGGSMAAGGYALGSVLPAAGGGSAAAAPAAAAAPGQLSMDAAMASAAGTGAVPVGGLTAAAGAAGSLSIADQLKKALTSPGGVANLTGLIASLAAGSGSGGGENANLLNQSPQLQELMQMGTERVKRTDPLHQSITQLAMSRLPTNVQR